MVEKHPVLNRDEWLQRRRSDLTASDIGAAAGHDRFKTPLALYAEKSGYIIGDTEDTPAMRRGRWLENAVMAALKEEHPDWEIKPVGIYYREPLIRLGATPDFVAVTDQPGVTNIQAKIVSRPAFEKHWADGPPMNYVLQTLCEGMLMDAQQSKIAALVIDTYSAALHEYEVPRHAEAEKRIVEIARKFWADVRDGKKPNADFTRDTDVIEAIYPQSQAEPALDLTGDNRLAELLPQYAVLKDMLAIDKAKLAEMETEIKEKLGSAEIATLPGWKLTWKTQTRKAHQVKEATYRVLRVTDLDERDQEEAA